MPTKPQKKIALDSVVIIDLLQQKAGRAEHIRPRVIEAEKGELVICVSAMARAETCRLCTPAQPDDESTIDDFYRRTWVYPQAVTLEVARRATEIQRTHGIDCADAVHLASAIWTQASVFLTNDGQNPMKKKRHNRPVLALDQKIMVDGKPFRIMTPEDYEREIRAAALPLWTTPTNAPVGSPATGPEAAEPPAASIANPPLPAPPQATGEASTERHQLPTG